MRKSPTSFIFCDDCRTCICKDRIEFCNCWLADEAIVALLEFWLGITLELIAAVLFKVFTTLGVVFKPFCTISATSCGNLSFGAMVGFGGSGNGLHSWTKNANGFVVSTEWRWVKLIWNTFNKINQSLSR